MLSQEEYRTIRDAVLLIEREECGDYRGTRLGERLGCACEAIYSLLAVSAYPDAATRDAIAKRECPMGPNTKTGTE